MNSLRAGTSDRRRFNALALRVRQLVIQKLRAETPVAGLYLTGQDVGSAGITGAMMGGMLSAAALEPALFAKIS